MQQKSINQEILEKLNKIQIDINILKNNLKEEELTDYAKEELEKARNESEETYTSLEDLRKEIEDEIQG